MKYTNLDKARQKKVKKSELGFECYRSSFWRDYARLLHSPSFRRLQGKTQLFPGHESDFFRNRLTHSLEVAQIAESITYRVNHKLKIENSPHRIKPAVVRFASIAHDLGHPPFGHLGEEVLNLKMREYGGFEGNAQTLRIVARLEKKEIVGDNIFPIVDGEDMRLGLNLTYRSLASILKYDNPIKMVQDNGPEGAKVLHPEKGYYSIEADLVKEIKDHVAPGFEGLFKSVECSIMDVADDIAYCTYDLEDAFKAGFVTPLDILSSKAEIWKSIAKKVNDSLKKEHYTLGKEGEPKTVSAIDVNSVTIGVFMKYIDASEGDEEDFHRSMIETFSTSKLLAKDGYLRTPFTSYLVGQLIREVDIIINEEHPSLSQVFLNENARILVETLKQFTWQYQILNNRLRIVANRGIEIVSTLFEIISENPSLMPDDYIDVHNAFDDKNMKMRTVCDFISSMTDRYAIEFYGRLKSENPETIFKPL